jgi:CBS domain-containing protein
VKLDVGHSPAPLASELLDTEVAELMTPGCVTISEDASVGQAAQALAAHRSHAVLVVGTAGGGPLGWVTARGLLGWLDRDRSLVSAREAITEQVTAIHPDEPVSTARRALSNPGVTHLVVRRGPNLPPEGVITDFDLAVMATP